jgi:hypothetical protein
MLELLLALTLAPAAAQAADLPPKAVLAQLPPGYEVLLFKAGQLNEDSRPGYLVVAHRPNDSAQTPSPRPLLIFVPGPDGVPKLAARNDQVVLRADEGGQCDPFDDGEDGLAIKDRYFTVQNSVACGQHWSDYITFHYDAARRTWLFHKQVIESSEPLADKPPTQSVTVADRRHPVTFEAWRPPK